MCNKVWWGPHSIGQFRKKDGPRSRHRMGAGRMMWWHKWHTTATSCTRVHARTHAHMLIFSLSTNFIFLENHLLKKQLLRSGGPVSRGRRGVMIWCVRAEDWDFYKKNGRVVNGRLAACLPVCMCTYAHIHLLGSVYLMHTHIYIPIHTCKWCVKSTSVRVGVCIAYIFTCTISSCV